MSSLALIPGQVTLADLAALYSGATAAHINPAARPGVEASAARVAAAAAGEAAIYGINTGFGKLAGVRIPDDQLGQLQKNLLLSHATGVGEPLSLE